MSTGPALPLADIDGATTIDAAILDDGPLVGSLTPLLLAPAIAPGAYVSVKAGSPFTAQVLRIFDHPTYYGNMFSHRVFIDAVGVSGDSGSLVGKVDCFRCCGFVYWKYGRCYARGNSSEHETSRTIL